MPHQQPHHPVEKSTGLDLQREDVAITLQAHLLDGGAGVGALAARPLKGRKVVVSEQLLQELLHQLVLQAPLVAVPADGCQKQIRSPRVVDAVAIAPVRGAEAGMPIGCHGGTGPHANAAWQSAIKGWGPARRWDRPMAIEVNHLGGGMDAGVGAPGGNGAAQLGGNASG